MNCKWAEGHLSACLDGTLDPAVRDEVTTHVEGCAHCGSILKEFRYFDGLVASLPRYEPPEDLRQRIFESPELAAIVRSLNDPDEVAEPARHPVTSNPFGRSRSATLDRSARPAHDRLLTPLPLPSARASDEGASGGTGGSDGAGATTGRSQPGQGGKPAWTRVALSVAAAVALVLGSGLLIQRAMPHTTVGSKPGICCVGGPPPGPPLSAGPRVVYERGGALWSAPEQGGGPAQQLTPHTVTVGAGWAISPIQTGAGGDSVAYIDLKTGAVHVVRSDDQKDEVVGQAATRGPHGVGASFWSTEEGRSILAGLAWSPDGSHLAYLGDTAGTGRTTLTVVRADGTAPAAIPTAVGVSSGMGVWSPDGLRIAFVQTGDTGQTVWDFNVSSRLMRELSPTDGSASGAVVRAVGWLPQTMGPVVTWAAGDSGGTYADLYSRNAVQDGQPQRLTPAGASFTAADYTAQRNGGTWLLGDGEALYAVSAHIPGLAQLVTVPGGVRAVAWAPNGTAAAFVSVDGELQLWVPGVGFQQVTGGVAAEPNLVWAPDGSALAFVANGQTTIVRLSAGVPGAPIAVSGTSETAGLAWAPDGQRLAIATRAGVELVNADGSNAATVDTHPADGALVWSVAR